MTELFSAPFGPLPELRASIIPRWVIIKTSRPQSVAEHSFNVAMIVRGLCRELMYSFEITNSLMVSALDHDLSEIWSGDIPTPAKGEREIVPTLLKLADMMEAYIFITNNSLESAGVMGWMVDPLRRQITKMAQELSVYEYSMKIIDGVKI